MTPVGSDPGDQRATRREGIDFFDAVGRATAAARSCQATQRYSERLRLNAPAEVAPAEIASAEAFTLF